MRSARRAAVVGSGPNGLAAAIRLAASGVDVTLYESSDYLGGSVRSVADSTYSSIIHDWGASSFPLALNSPAFVGVNWHDLGVEWLTGPISFSHAMPQVEGFLAYQDIDEMISYLGKDGGLWGTLFRPRKHAFAALSRAFLDRKALRHLDARLLRFGPMALVPAATTVRCFPGGIGGAGATLFGAAANHSQLSLRSLGSSGVGLFLISAAHTVGWPIPRGGAGRLTQALIDLAVSLGVKIFAGHPVLDPRQLDSFEAIIWATHPSFLTGNQNCDLSRRARRRLANWGISGVSVTKLDFVVEGRVPWGNPQHQRAPIVHLGGSFTSMLESKNLVRSGGRPTTPYMILSQPGTLDESRWSEGLQPVSVYIQHSPETAQGGLLEHSHHMIEQIEQCAPGFGSRVRSTVQTLPFDLEAQNRNLQQGDIYGGASSFRELLRGPSGYLNHYRVGRSHHFLGSSATWPGTGAHGMSGYNAANRALEILGHGF